MKVTLSSVLVRGAIAAALVLVPGLLPAQEDCVFVRGDVVDLDPSGPSVVDLNDGVAILAFLFVNQSEPVCQAAADVNDNGLVELSDYTYLVEFLFNGGPAPPSPFPEPGVDPTPGVTVPEARDERFAFGIGSSAGVPSNTGIAIPITLSNAEPITGLMVALKYDPQQVRIDELVTEEGTVLSAQSCDYIIAEARHTAGIATISAIKDFATPFYFHDGSDPTIPAGENQLVATLKCGIVISADKGFAEINFVDGLRIPDSAATVPPPENFPEIHNLVMLGSTAVRPVLSTGGGIDIRRGFIRGDANKDSGVDISDPVFVINYVFLGGRVPPCLDAADANNDTRLDISDSIWLLNYLFKGGPQPSEPFPQAGVDPSDDGKGSLGCESDR